MIYLDNAATTKPDPTVLDAMNVFLTEKYGNPASVHKLGQEALDALENARKTIADAVHANPDEIFFTSGGTESNNWAMKGIAFANKHKGNHIITTKIEHKCILESCTWLEKHGFTITYLDVNHEGVVDPKGIEKAITKNTILVSVIHGSNEVGTIQDIKTIGAICKKHKVYFHTDACQSFTKTELNAKDCDLITINAHKIHGPRGIGALVVKKGTIIEPLLHGGGQESNKRSGTVNVAGAVGFAEAVKLAMDPKHVEHMKTLRDTLIKGILMIPGTTLNGSKENRLCNNVHISFKQIEGEALNGHLDQHGICASTGSACSERTLAPNYVLQALKLPHEDANGSIRLTLSRFTTEQEIEKVLNILPNVVDALRKISPIGR